MVHDALCDIGTAPIFGYAIFWMTGLLNLLILVILFILFILLIIVLLQIN